MSLQTGQRLAIVAAVVGLIFLLRSIMVPLFAAYLLMLLWQPAHQRMSKRLGKNWSAFLCTLISFFAPVLLLLSTIPDLNKLVAFIAEADLEAMKTWLERTLASLSNLLPDGWLDSIRGEGLTGEQTAERTSAAAQLLASVGSWLLAVFGGILGLVSLVVLLPIFLYYLLSGGPWRTKLRKELPAAWHDRFDRVLPRIEAILCSFLRTRFLVGVVKGGIALCVLLALGFPGAYSLALLLGIFSILPVIGPFIAFLAVASVGLLDGGFTGGGWPGLIAAASLSISLELLEGYVLLPRMVGPEVGLSDFAVVLAMLFGAALGGFLGVLVAIPVMAVGRVLYIEYLRPVMKEPSPAPAK